jgi:hypothetical protein
MEAFLLGADLDAGSLTTNCIGLPWQQALTLTSVFPHWEHGLTQWAILLHL